MLGMLRSLLYTGNGTSMHSMGEPLPLNLPACLDSANMSIPLYQHVNTNHGMLSARLTNSFWCHRAAFLSVALQQKLVFRCCFRLGVCFLLADDAIWVPGLLSGPRLACECVLLLKTVTHRNCCCQHIYDCTISALTIQFSTRMAGAHRGSELSDLTPPS